MISYLDLEKETFHNSISYRPILIFLFFLVLMFFFVAFFPVTEEIKYEGVLLEGDIHSVIPVTFQTEIKNYSNLAINGKKYPVSQIELKDFVTSENHYYREIVFKVGEIPLQEGDAFSFFLQKGQTTILEKLIHDMKGVSE